MRRPEFAFVQARLQARLGDFQRTVRWPSIEASRGVAQFLAALRATALGRWVEGFDESVDAHRVEAALREKWAAYVVEVARWQPPPWRAATRWFGLLPELPRIDALRRAGALRPAPDASTQGATIPFALTSPLQEPPLNESMAVNRSELGSFGAKHATAGDGATATIWVAEFRRRVPRDAGDLDTIRPARWLLPTLGGDRTGRGRASGRAAAALVRHLHRLAGSPPAVFAFLALVALDVERLRGGLLVRQLLPRTPQGEDA